MSREVAISINHLSKKYILQHAIQDAEGNLTNELWALNDVSLDIYKGESIGILGPNGSGKSTLLKILAGVTEPTAGRIEINGRIASILDIGAGFHPELSGRENVFLNGQILGFTKKEIQQNYDAILDFSGIEKFIDEPVKNYSNGMYLRLAFSIMAHLDFDIYLFDEVFNVGDADFVLKTQKKFQDLIASDKTMLVVSHNTKELENKDLYVLLNNGRIKESTPNAELLSAYLEQSTKKDNTIIAESNIVINDFSKYGCSGELKLMSVELCQFGETSFRTDKPLKLKINLQKITNADSLDMVVRISDIQGNVLMSVLPLLSGHTSIQNAGNYYYTCDLPADYFGFQTYQIGLFFVKNTLSVLKDSESEITLTEERLTRVASSIIRFDNIVCFKPQLKLGNSLIDVRSLNLNGGLFPILDWQTNYQAT